MHKTIFEKIFGIGSKSAKEYSKMVEDSIDFLDSDILRDSHLSNYFKDIGRGKTMNLFINFNH